MSIRLLNCFKNLRMSHQTMFINFCFLSFTVILILITYFIQSAIFFGFIQSFTQVLSQYQEENLVRKVSYQLRQYISQKNHNCNFLKYIAILNLQHTNLFLHYIFEVLQDQNQTKVEISYNQFEDCVEQEQANDRSIIYNSDIICQVLSTTDYNKQAALYNQSISLLVPFIQQFQSNNDAKISILQLPISQIFASFPKMFKYKNFIPQERPWAVNHLKQIKINPKQEYYYSPVFISVKDNLPYFTITYSFKQDDSLIGIIAQLQPISDVNIQNIPLNIALINNGGEVIFSTIESILQLNQQLYIYNVSQTGFNQTDWDQIQQTSTSVDISTSTNLYLENKSFKRKVYINTFNFKQENLTLIVFKNVTYEQDVTKKFESLVSFLSDIIIQQIYVQISCCFFLIVITVKFINYIFTPLIKLIETIKLHVREMGNNLNTEIFKMVCKNKKSSDLFSSLTYQFMAFKDIQSRSALKKNRLCQEIESIPYSFRYQELDCQEIREQFHKIPLLKSSQFPKLLRFDSFKKINVNSQVLNPATFNCNDEDQRIIFVKQVLLRIFRQNSQ